MSTPAEIAAKRGKTVEEIMGHDMTQSRQARQTRRLIGQDASRSRWCAA